VTAVIGSVISDSTIGFTDRGTDEAPQKICCAQRPLHGSAWSLMVAPATSGSRTKVWWVAFLFTIIFGAFKLLGTAWVFTT